MEKGDVDTLTLTILFHSPPSMFQLGIILILSCFLDTVMASTYESLRPCTLSSVAVIRLDGLWILGLE